MLQTQPCGIKIKLFYCGDIGVTESIKALQSKDTKYYFVNISYSKAGGINLIKQSRFNK